MDFDSTGRVLAALEREGVRYVVVGAAAINLPGTLYRMKKGTVRLKDQADAALLKERFKIEDS
jgi:hypothetical protein